MHDNDRHLIAAALVMVNGLDEEDDPERHKVMIVSDNTKHLAVAETRKLGSKMGMDATNKWPGETSREWGRTMQMTPEVTAKVEVVWQGLGL